MTNPNLESPIDGPSLPATRRDLGDVIVDAYQGPSNNVQVFKITGFPTCHGIAAFVRDVLTQLRPAFFEGVDLTNKRVLNKVCQSAAKILDEREVFRTCRRRAKAGANGRPDASGRPGARPPTITRYIDVSKLETITVTTTDPNTRVSSGGPSIESLG